MQIDTGNASNAKNQCLNIFTFKGSFGRVRLAKSKQNSEYVALKMLKKAERKNY